MPLISKIFFKDSPNDTVKGYDSVHVVEVPDGLDLWLGEVKFYDDAAGVARDVIKELHGHTRIDYLRTEFTAIWRKIDRSPPPAGRGSAPSSRGGTSPWTPSSGASASPCC